MLAGRPRQDAEDVVQDVFERPHRVLRQDRSRPIDLRPWPYRIAHNRCLDELWRPGPTPAAALLELMSAPLDDRGAIAQRREDLRAA